MDKIDFVVPWVDGGDPEWIKQKSQYSGQTLTGNETERFRDWDQLKYWFRGVEKFAPWVNQIHFITCGHIPEWLNTDHPKLHWVRHEDYIPAEYLPVFNANPIELNIHRIENLSEKFVYFNDDFFLINHVKPTDFFRGNIPCSNAGLGITGIVHPVFAGILHNDRNVVNRNFNSKKVILANLWKWVHPCYGFKRNLQTLCLIPFCTSFFPGFYNSHGPNAFLKSTFNEVWEAEGDRLRNTCKNRFRSYFDVNQYAFLWWQWCKGQFVPQDVRKMSTYLTVLMPDEQIINTITGQSTPIVILNDDWVDDFERKKVAINGAFDTILGEKSSFEK